MITIPFSTEPGKPNKNGIIFTKDSMQKAFESCGYFNKNVLDTHEENKIPVRFFKDEKSYSSTISSLDGGQKENSFYIPEKDLWDINKDLSPYVSNNNIMFFNNKYHLSISIPKSLYEENKKYMSSCHVSMIVTTIKNKELENNVYDIIKFLYLDIF